MVHTSINNTPRQKKLHKTSTETPRKTSRKAPKKKQLKNEKKVLVLVLVLILFPKGKGRVPVWIRVSWTEGLVFHKCRDDFPSDCTA